MNKLKITNNTDRDMAAQGLIPVEKVRSVEIDALVDTGATMLAIPEEVAEALGLPDDPDDTRRVRDAMGVLHELRHVFSLNIELLGRRMSCDALVLPRGAIALIGQVVLEQLDLIVDPKNQEVRVNPASPDVPLLDLLAIAPAGARIQPS